VTLDALRGVAAVSVMWFHSYVFSRLPETLEAPGWLDIALRNGGMGVDVFFVLSGVVMTLSVAGDHISLGYLGRFAVRRSLRLDPPYWFTLILAASLLATQHHWPGLDSVAAHIVYLQNILGYRNIVSQFWSLCYEVQFYLILVLSLWLTQRFGRAWGRAWAMLLFLSSLAVVVGQIGTQGWFLDHWYAFAAGSATALWLLGRLPLATLVVTIGLTLAAGWRDLMSGPVVAAVTALAIAAAGGAGKLGVWSGGPVLQWLGRISYSLYLIHFIGSAVAKTLAVRASTRFEAVAVFCAATGASLAAAELLYRLVERPAQRLSRRVGTSPNGHWWTNPRPPVA
jgi:peptidoglycan/LPS O-acetylase OafA/YrhL